MKPKVISLNAGYPSPLSGMTDGVSGKSHSSDNPFVGLRPFKSTESLLFFGRFEQTKELLQLLHDARFLSIVGSSGCGKSSLIQAGLIPKLKAGFLAGRRDQWRIATMKPGDAPLQNLASALLEAFSEEPPEESVTSLTAAIRESGLQAIVDYLSVKLSRASANVLLLVDQFEEIFRFGLYADKGESQEMTGDTEQRRDEATDFVSLMLQLAQQEKLPVYVVMTMRSDFLGDCDAFQGLPEAMNRSQYLVPRLTRQQRQEAIESPIRLYGAEITPRLLDRVLNDVGDESDQLPVMQHALMRTWENWQEKKTGPIDIEHYEAVGMIKEALSRDADKALEGMSKEELFIAERLFQALTDTDVKGRRLRRPVHLSDIEAITGADRQKILEIIERFRSSNRSFLTLSHDRIEGDPLIDISHESLIRQWKTLRTWTDAEAESKELYLRLAGDAVRYDKDQVPLWSDPALQFALDWRTNRQPNEAWARRYHPEFQRAMDFLDKSEAQRERIAAETERQREAEARREREELEKAQQYAEQQRLLAEERAAARQRDLEAAQQLAAQQESAARRLRRYLLALALFSLVAIAAAGTAVYAFIQAKKNARVAEEAQKSTETLSTILRSILESEREATQEAEQSTRVADEAKRSAEALANSLSESLNREKESTKRAEAQTQLALKSAKEAAAATKKAKDASKQLEGALTTARDEAKKAEKARIEAVTAKEQAEKTKGANQTHRDALKALATSRQEEAIEKFDLAAKAYEGIEDFDGQAYTYTEIGGVLFERAISTSEETETAVNVGLDYLSKAEGIYRELDDHNGLGALYSKVGEYLIRLSEKNEEQDEWKQDELVFSSTEIRTIAIANFCEAAKQYKDASNLDGQIKMLARIGDVISEAQQAEGEETERDAGSQQNGDKQKSKRQRIMGCSEGQDEAPVKYYEQTIPLYQSLIQQPTKNQDVTRRRRDDFAAMLIKIGGIYIKQDAAKASESFKSAIALYSGANDIDGQSKTFIRIGDLLEEGELEDDYYKRATKIYRDAKMEKKEAEALLKVADSYASKYLDSFSETGAKKGLSRKYAQKQLEVSQQALQIYKSGTPKEQAAGFMAVGLAQRNLSQYDEAIASYNAALKIAAESTDTLLTARVLTEIGSVHMVLSQYEQSLEAYGKARELFLKVDSPAAKSQANILHYRIQSLRRIMNSLKDIPQKQ